MTKLSDMGTSGLAEYVRAAKNGRSKNLRRMHAERVLVSRYPVSSFFAVERFRNLVSCPLPGVDERGADDCGAEGCDSKRARGSALCSFHRAEESANDADLDCARGVA